MLIKHISIVIMAKNAEETIEECLQSLIRFREVILYLNDSVDKTKELATHYTNVKIFEGEFIGFGPTKNKAASFAKNDWILSLDSDEILNNVLINEILQQNYNHENVVFILKRDNYFLGANTISKDYIARIYNSKHTELNQNTVHEKVMISKSTQVKKLKHSFRHLNITDINQTLTKMIKYTDLAAENKKICFFPIVIAKAVFAFIQSYFLRLYFLDGWRGFTISITNANSRFYKYLKQYINCQDGTK